MELPTLFKISPDPSLPKRGIQLVVIFAKEELDWCSSLLKRGTQLAPYLRKSETSFFRRSRMEWRFVLASISFAESSLILPRNSAFFWFLELTTSAMTSASWGVARKR